VLAAIFRHRSRVTPVLENHLHIAVQCKLTQWKRLKLQDYHSYLLHPLSQQQYSTMLVMSRNREILMPIDRDPDPDLKAHPELKSGTKKTKQNHNKFVIWGR